LAWIGIAPIFFPPSCVLNLGISPPSERTVKNVELLFLLIRFLFSSLFPPPFFFFLISRKSFSFTQSVSSPLSFSGVLQRRSAPRRESPFPGPIGPLVLFLLVGLLPFFPHPPPIPTGGGKRVILGSPPFPGILLPASFFFFVSHSFPLS